MEVEQHQIGLQRLCELDRSGTVRGLADDVEASRREQRCKRIPCERMVVDDEDSLGHLLLSSADS